jgi:hypothetical protein
MKNPRLLIAAAALTAATLLLSGCLATPRPTVTVTETVYVDSPDATTPETEPVEPEESVEPTPVETTEAPTTNTGASGDVAAPGARFNIGDTAILPFTTAINRIDQNIEVTITGIRKGTQDDFADLDASSRKQLADVVPYYVDFTVKKGSPDKDELAFNSVSSSYIGAQDQDGDRVSPLIIFGTFKACDAPSFGKEIDEGETYSGCVPFAGTSAKTVTAATWQAYDTDYAYYDGDPVVWS